MPVDRSEIFRAVRSQLELQALEQQELRGRLLRSVVSKTATGITNIGHTFSLDRKYRVVFVRCHFSGAPGTADLTISLDSLNGSAFDTRLFSVLDVGVDNDVHLRIGDGDTIEPSAWTFQVNDAIRIDWTNPDSGNITWGLEVGLVLAS